MDLRLEINELEFCGSCNQGFFSEDFLYYSEIENEYYCNHCKKTELYFCHNCDKEIIKDFEDTDGNNLCESCFHEEYFFCAECGEITSLGESELDKNEELICPSCFERHYFRCENCESIFSQDESHGNSYHGLFCGECFFEDHEYCSECNEIICLSSNDYEIIDDECLCQHCAESHNSNRSIQDYHASKNRTKKFFRSKKDVKDLKEFFGLELEVESYEGNNLESTAQDIIDLNNSFLHCEEDGSLDDGFEIITEPFSRLWYRENKDLFEKAIDILQENEFSSFKSGNCGIHIHISKKSFETLHLYKMLKFFYDPENFKFIKLISQRGSATTYFQHETKDVPEMIDLAKTKKSDGSRYTYANLTNSSTIEIRIFRGTLNKTSFFKNFDFIFGLIDFTKESGIKDVTPQNFMKYMELHKKEYSAFNNFYKKKQESFDTIIGRN
jgi:hypothetical protein